MKEQGNKAVKLVCRNIRDIAEGEWSRYFRYRWTKKWSCLLIVPVAILVVGLLALFVLVAQQGNGIGIGNGGSDNPVSTELLSVTEPSTLKIAVLDNYALIVTDARGEELPTVQSRSVVGVTAKNESPANGVAFLMAILFLAPVFVYFIRYWHDGHEFILRCEQEWVNSNYTKLPSRQSVLDFIKEL